MATTIKLKNGSGAPLAGDLVAGEPALDLTNKRLYTEDTGGTVIEVGTNPTSLTTGTFTSTGIDDNATSTAITIDSSQNVGIGTASPSDQLEVSAASPAILITDTDTSDTFRLKQTNTLSEIQASTDFAIDTNGSEAMRIDSSGNVGIGTASPNHKLTLPQVDGTSIGMDASTGFTLDGTSCTYYGLTYQNGTGTGFNTILSGYDNILFATLGAERLRIDSSGNVGIGVTPSFKVHVGGDDGMQHFIQGGTNLSTQSSYYVAQGRALFGYDAGNVLISDNSASKPIVFETAGSERARLDTSGTLLVGTTSGSLNSYTHRQLVYETGAGSASAVQGLYKNSTSSGRYFTIYHNPNGVVGSVSNNATSVSYNTTSDYRLKENVVDLNNGINRLKQIPVHRFNFIADPDTTVDGFLAHEVQDVVPEAITGAKDGMTTEEYEVSPAVLDEEGNVVTEAVMGTREVPEYQGIDQSKLVPLLTAALQEAVTRIETLEAEVAALKGA